MAAPIPGGKSWSASNATSGATYETTSPMTTELPKGKFGDITKWGSHMISGEEMRALYPKIAQILKAAEGEGGGGSSPEMQAMKMEHAEEKHEQEMRHKEELHQLKVHTQTQAIQQKEEAAVMKQQEMGMQMPPEPPPPPDPAQQQSMIDAAFENLPNKEPQIGPLKEGAMYYNQGFDDTLVRLGIKTAEEMHPAGKGAVIGGLSGLGLGALGGAALPLVPGELEYIFSTATPVEQAVMLKYPKFVPRLLRAGAAIKGGLGVGAVGAGLGALGGGLYSMMNE